MKIIENSHYVHKKYKSPEYLLYEVIVFMAVISAFSALLLIFVGGYFTFAFGGFYFRHPIKTLKMMPLESGVKEMLLSLGGTVGVGNISGVAVAILLGGSGAVFWMWVGALFAMALKYAEITLGMLERRGAAHYIKKALGTLASVLFSVLLIADCIMMGGMIQSNAISEAMYAAFDIAPVYSGIFVSVAAAVVFFLGVNLFSLSMYIVPLMSAGYVIMSLAVILYFASDVGYVINDIFSSAFDISAVGGGVLGLFFTPALRQGIVKGLFSNEAGCGTAPSAHAASNEKVPARQGLFGIFEVFIDTVVMCTLTAFVILLTSSAEKGSGGVAVCINAFASVFGSLAPPLIALFVFLFAFSAIVSFGYYGMSSIPQKGLKNLFLLFYCFSLASGAAVSPVSIWGFADTVISLMLIINTTAVFCMRKSVICAHRQLLPHRKKVAKGR